MGTLRAFPNRRPRRVLIDEASWDEARMEGQAQAAERLDFTVVVRRHVRVALRALSESRYAYAATFLLELERLNEREAIQAQSALATKDACPDGIQAPAHGRAA